VRETHGHFSEAGTSAEYNYVDAEAFRFKARKTNDAKRFGTVAGQVVGRRLTYKKVIGQPDTDSGKGAVGAIGWPMKKRSPKPGEGPRPSDSFKTFQETVKRLLAVSKRELDELRAAERAKKHSGNDRAG